MAVTEKEERAEIIKVLSLCILWYSISSGNNVVGKMLLNEFPYPMSVTMVQLLSITFFSGPVLKLMGVRRQTDISWKYYKMIILPLALGKFLASVFSHVSLWKVPVSYAHTVKATMPLFTVILSRVCFGEKQSNRVYLSLVPIILGVAIATITELSFDAIGLVSALTATCGFSLQNIFSKKVLNDTGIHPLRLLHLLGRLALMMFLPVWLIFDGYTMMNDAHLVVRRSGADTLLLLAVDGGLNWLQNLVAFSILYRVAPLTYAVASATKRVAIVSVSLFVLGNPVTSFNVLGMLLAILGVLAYNKAKYDANKALKRTAAAAILPMTSSYSNGGVAPLMHQVHPSYLYDLSRSTTGPAFGPLHHPTDIANGFATTPGDVRRFPNEKLHGFAAADGSKSYPYPQHQTAVGNGYVHGDGAAGVRPSVAGGRALTTRGDDLFAQAQDLYVTRGASGVESRPSVGVDGSWFTKQPTGYSNKGSFGSQRST